MKPSSLNAPTFNNNNNKNANSIRWCLTLTNTLPPFFFLCLILSTFLTLFLLYSPTPTPTPPSLPSNPPNIVSRERDPHPTGLVAKGQRSSTCDVSRGRWVREARPRSYYTNSSCTTIPESKNCFLQGRQDKGFLDWRWRPYRCKVPRFDPRRFLEMVRGKTMAFVGDSVARNHFDSLLCLLSQAEKPIDVYKDSEDRFRTWRFAEHGFTLKMLWSKFLVYGQEKPENGSFPGGNYLYLDKVDDKWVGELPGTDYAIISSAHWFFRQIHLYDGPNQIGCVYCDNPNVTSYGPEHAIQLAFRAAFRHINENCEGCDGMITLVRTFSPAHFENGSWNTGGSCPRTKPRGEREVRKKSSYEMGFRDRQVEEVRKAVGEAGKKKKGKRFGVVDVSEAMLMRPDGHPGEFWGNKWMKGYNDCVHWCLPGPIDSWNEMLMEILSREIGELV